MSFNDLFKKESELRKTTEDGKNKPASDSKPETASDGQKADGSTSS